MQKEEWEGSIVQTSKLFQSHLFCPDVSFIWISGHDFCWNENWARNNRIDWKWKYHKFGNLVILTCWEGQIGNWLGRIYCANFKTFPITYYLPGCKFHSDWIAEFIENVNCERLTIWSFFILSFSLAIRSTFVEKKELEMERKGRI